MLPLSAEAEPGDGSRVALVIGNARYRKEVGALKNPVRDAKAVAKSLRGLGFSVTEEHNVTRDELWEAIAQFRKRVKGSELALFYYAGHGISLAGGNYLVPLKSNFQMANEGADASRLLAETRLFNADQVLAEMQAAGKQCNLVILDACRNTPLARDPSVRDTAMAGGLTHVRPPAGSLVAFATEAGRVASDGEQANGLYTSELIKHLETPGLMIEQVFKRTRSGVIKRSGGKQLPVEYSRLVGQDIYLAGRPVSEPDQPVPPKAQEVTLPSIEEIHRMAAAGQVDACLAALELRASVHGPMDAAAAPLDALLEMAKDGLKRPQAASVHTGEIRKICEKTLTAIFRYLPEAHPRRMEMAAKAQNRRGDCLLLENKAEEAIKCYNAAIEMAPDDAYPHYNRGRAHRQLGKLDLAKADFLKAAEPAFRQPKARSLAMAALEGLAQSEAEKRPESPGRE